MTLSTPNNKYEENESDKSYENQKIIRKETVSLGMVEPNSCTCDIPNPII